MPALGDDDEARRRGTQKTVLERKAPPTFDVLIEIQGHRRFAVRDNVAAAVDEVLARSGGAVVTLDERQLAAIDGLDRLRYTSPHPKDMREDVIRAHAELPALCEHIHLPLQSGSTPVLKRMRRTYGRERYMDRVALIREHVPDCAITTDIITDTSVQSEHHHGQQRIRGVGSASPAVASIKAAVNSCDFFGESRLSRHAVTAT